MCEECALTLPHIFDLSLITPAPGLFSWHPTLMVLAYVAAMFEGVLVYSPHSSLIGGLSRPTKVTIHWSLATFSALLAVGGLAVIFQVCDQRGVLQCALHTCWCI